MVSSSSPHRLGSGLKSILVASDCSEGALPVLRRAARLPLQPGGAIVVVHVLNAAFDDRARVAEESRVWRELERQVARLRDGELAGRELEIEIAVLFGDPYVEIVKHARKVGAELLVMGRRTRRTVRGLLIGSTVERVVRTSHLPVLVVKRMPSKNYARPVVAVALDFASVRTVRLAMRVAPNAKTLTVAHAYHVPFEGLVAPTSVEQNYSEYSASFKQAAQSGMRRLVEGVGSGGERLKGIVRKGEPRAVISSELTWRRADLVCLATHGRSGLARALIGSVAEWTVRGAPCDVLIAPVDCGSGPSDSKRGSRG